MDEGCSRAVRVVFVRLYDEGLIYRANRIINWCPRCHTALSDIEVEHEDVDGELVHIRYPFADGDGSISVATTRAETMLGDTGVAVHPDDERYAGAIGRTLILPLVGREIPVVADTAVDPEFGTGAVKVTPAHDPNDFEIAARANLPAVDIFTESAVVNENGGRFAGLARYAARDAVKEALRSEGMLEGIEEHRHADRPLLPVPHRGRAPALAAVVREVEAAGGPGRRGGGRRPDAVRARELGEALLRLAGEPAGLVRLPPDLVGAPHPGLVLPGLRPGHRLGRRPDVVQRLHVGRPHAGRGRPRHLVLLGAVALHHAGVAGADRRPRPVLSQRHAPHRVRHHLLLGGPDDADGPALPGRRPVPGGGHPRPGARRRGPQDVEVLRQRRRPAGAGRPLRRRRPALRPHPGGQPRPRRPPGRGVGRRGPQLRQQAVELGPVRGHEPRRPAPGRARGGRSTGRRTSGPCPSGGSCPAWPR